MHWDAGAFRDILEAQPTGFGEQLDLAGVEREDSRKSNLHSKSRGKKHVGRKKESEVNRLGN